VVLDSLDAKGGGDVAFSGAGPTDQHDVVGAVHEVAAVELTHQSFVDLAGGKVEAGQVLVSREAGGLDLIGDRADLALGHFCLEQLGEHRDGRLEGWCALFDQIAHGLRHAVHLEAAQHRRRRRWRGHAARFSTCAHLPERVVDLDIGPGLLVEAQGLRRIDGEPVAPCRRSGDAEC
jgi:hypothetical protein